MANITEELNNPQWAEGIYQLETTDPVLGGPNGIANRQAKELAARTQYLKKKQEEYRPGAASTTKAGIVQLSSTTNSDSEELAATPKAVKAAYDKAVGAKASLATNTVPGLVKLINNLTSGGTDAALTAEQGKVLAAALENKSDKGHIHTAAEIKQAVVDLFQPQQHSGTGYQRLPNGFAFQWGVVNEKWAGERPQKITFPVSFTACYGVFLGSIAEGTTQNVVLIDSTWGVQAMTNASFEAIWNTWSTGNASHLRGFYWIAIGLL